MFSIFKKNNDYHKVPLWASFFSDSEYNTFIQAIEKYFSKKKINYELADDMITVKESDFGFNELGLINVAQVCKQNSPRNYKTIINDHFEAMIRAHDFDIDFNKIIHDYDKIKNYIGVRLYPNGYAEHVGKNFTIGKDLADGIYAMLVFDLPESIVGIKPEEADKWNRSMDELFEVGLQNIKNNYPVEISKEQFDGIKIWLAQGDHFFAPNMVFDLKLMQKYTGTHGALVGIPHRHAVIIYPIEQIEVVNAINALIPAISAMCEQGPGSISTNIFWYKDGVFENLPYQIEEDKLQFYPPENFIALLNTLTV